MSGDRIRVLVVDDSAFARKVIREVLSSDPQMEVVGIARDGLEALEKIEELHPDVVTLDLMMPDLDGLGVLRALPRKGGPRVVVVSISGAESDIAIEALQSGAVDLVLKPTPLPTDRLYDLAGDLLAKVRAAGVATPRLEPFNAFPAPPISLSPAELESRLVVIGTSTGGPQALTEIFKALPEGIPVPIAIALHIPAGYTASLAERLSRIGKIPVEEACDGMELRPGRAIIAPGGKHLRIGKSAGKLCARVGREPLESLHVPSVDELFESAAEAVGRQALAVVMTGMGDDGLRGARRLRSVGARVLAESSSSCVVYGMPRSVIEAGLADAEADLRDLPRLIVRYLQATRSNRGAPSELLL